MNESDIFKMDHNELLKMYRNWKKSESVIKFKNDEIKMLKNNSKYFEDSNIKLRGQVQALESVRDLVSTFQIQLSSLREENLQLKKENSELMELNQQVEFTLNQRLVDENHQIQQLTLVHENFKTLAEKYEKLEKSTKENSSNNVQEKVHNQSLETEIILLQTKLNQSKKEIYELNEKLSTANNRLTECDKELAHASNQLYNLSLEISYYTQTQKESSCNQWEIELLKNDISRLLKLVVHIPASSEFLKCWQDNQALSYIGGQSDPENINIKSFLNSSIHHDHDDECFIRHWNEAGFASSSELSHLKRIHYTSDVPSSIDLPTSFNVIIYAVVVLLDKPL
jgi:DNA repair exonuclease SbcCD ATPase subunit